MSSLTAADKSYLEAILDMRGGYVLDFTNATFGEFFSRNRIEIHDQEYQVYGTSKAKKMRAFWRIESDALVGRVLSELLDRYAANCDVSGRERDTVLLAKCRGIVNRLHGRSPTTQIMTAEGLLGEDSGREAALSTMSSTSPTAFISYSWDSEQHRDWVRELARRLRSDGVDVTLDRWHAAPGDQLTEFMERGVREHDFVVIICTPKYRERSDSREGGVGYEGDIMTGELLTKRNHHKFIPVWRSGTRGDAVPTWLASKYYIDLTGNVYDEQQYSDLVRTLLGDREPAPPVGERALQPAENRQSEAARQPRADRPGATGQFEDIQITRVIVEEVTEPRNDGTPGSALYTIPFQLSATPPWVWGEIFERHWDRPPQWTTMHRPGMAHVSGAKVLLEGTTIEEVQHYHRDTLMLVVKQANREYREIIEAAERKRRSEEEASERHRRNVDDVAGRITFE